MVTTTFSYLHPLFHVLLHHVHTHLVLHFRSYNVNTMDRDLLLNSRFQVPQSCATANIPTSGGLAASAPRDPSLRSLSLSSTALSHLQ